MRFLGVLHPVAVRILLQLFTDARGEFGARVGGCRSEGRCDGGSGQMLQREFVHMRQVDIDPIDAQLHVGKAGLRCKPLKVGSARTLPRRAKTGCGFRGYEASKRIADGAMISADTVPYAEREAATAVEHAPHLL